MSDGLKVTITELPKEAIDALGDSIMERHGRDLARMIVEEQRAAEPQFITVAEAAELLRAKRQRVYDLLHSRKLTAYGSEGARLVDRNEVMALIHGETNGTSAKNTFACALRSARMVANATTWAP